MARDKKNDKPDKPSPDITRIVESLDQSDVENPPATPASQAEMVATREILPIPENPLESPLDDIEQAPVAADSECPPMRQEITRPEESLTQDSSAETYMVPADLEQAIFPEPPAGRADISAEEQRHLHSLDNSDPMDRANSDCYAASKSCKPLLITFENLRAQSNSFVFIRADQMAIWSQGDAGQVGLKLTTSRDPVLYLRSFLINSREIFLQTYETCSEIQMQIYLRTEQAEVRGRVDLPPGAQVTLESAVDRTTIIGFSSFSIELGAS